MNVPDGNIHVAKLPKRENESCASDHSTHDGSARKVDRPGTPGSELPTLSDASAGRKGRHFLSESESEHFLLLNARKDMWRFSSGKDHVGVV